jgi:hypothetical protein
MIFIPIVIVINFGRSVVVARATIVFVIILTNRIPYNISYTNNYNEKNIQYRESCCSAGNYFNIRFGIPRWVVIIQKCHSVYRYP